VAIRPRSWRRASLRVALLASGLVTAGGRPVSAFDLGGHEIIEAAAYQRILSRNLVPGTGISGRALLATLIADGVLDQPPCFELDSRGRCRLGGRLDSPIAYWPVVGSGTLDLIIDRQLGQQGQCQHFMARTADGLAPLDPRLGLPGALATTAYTRCALILGLVFDGILRTPRLANWRMGGAYALMHGIQDSFSAAHAARDQQWRIVHLLSWKLIDWPGYLRRGLTSFPAATHHHVTDARDAEYLRVDGRSEDGARCDELANPYAVPESCLTARALLAVAAIEDLLVDLYRVRDQASRERRTATLTNPESAAIWREYVDAHLASAEATADLPTASQDGRSRPDVFLGALASSRQEGWGLGLWGARLLLGPALPFALTISAGAGYARVAGANTLGASAGMGLLLPLVGRFAIGAMAAGVDLQCNATFDGCALDPVATVGNLLVPLGTRSWMAVEGPRWSWTHRAFAGTLFGLAVGWAYEQKPHEAPSASLKEAALAWNPPRPDEVRAFRRSRGTFVAFAAATAASSAENEFIGAGLAWRLDRDRWDRRSGAALGLGIEIVHGVINGTPKAGAIAVGPVLAAYLVPNRLAVTAVPALVQLGNVTGPHFGADLAGRAGIAFDFGKVELAVDSPPLSYLSRERWHALPISVRLGLLFD
jgi:hypothetical protein